MHCPNCGMKASVGQKFCRACGLSLEKVEQLIADQKSGAADKTEEANDSLLSDRLRKLEKWITRALIALGTFFGGLILWIIIVTEIIEKGRIFEGGMVSLVLAAAVLVSIRAYLRFKLEKSASTQSKERQNLPQAPDTAKSLSESGIEMTSRVTEQTTAHLEEKLESRS